MVLASKVLSAKGRLVASPAMKSMSGRRRLPTLSMPREKSQATTSMPASAYGSLEVPVPAARSSTRWPDLHAHGIHHDPAPAARLPHGQDIVDDVVFGGDVVKHRGYFVRTLIQGCSVHPVIVSNVPHPHEPQASTCRNVPGPAMARNAPARHSWHAE